LESLVKKKLWTYIKEAHGAQKAPNTEEDAEHLTTAA
jgi:hypothetical protein